MAALKFRDLRVGYGRGPDVVAGVDLELAPGQAIAILGPSGGGKSTLLKAVAGLVPLREGRLEVLGHLHPQRPPAGSIGYIPQRLGLVRHTSVLDNVEHGGLHETSLWQSLRHKAPPEVTERSYQAIASVGLEGKEHEPIYRLSGGQQRRVAVARTLVQQPRLLLADEFLGELDPDTAATVAAAVQRLRRHHDTAVLMVEHRLEQAQAVADQVYRFADGQLEALVAA